MKITQSKPMVLLTTLACTVAISLIAQGVEAYTRHYISHAYRYSRAYSGFNYNAVYAQTRGRGGTLSESNVAAFHREFGQGQSTKALWTALGSPDHSDQVRDVWMIRRRDGSFSRLVAEYSPGGYGYTKVE